MDSGDGESGSGSDDDGEANPLIARRKELSTSAKTDLWFSQDLFAGIEDEDFEAQAEEDEAAAKMAAKKKRASKVSKEDEDVDMARFDGGEEEDDAAYEDALEAKRARRMKMDALDAKWTAKLGVSMDVDSADEFESEADTEDEDEAEQVIDAATEAMSEAATNGGFEEVPADAPSKSAYANAGNLDAAGLALATEMIARKRKREIIDSAYNRYAFTDDPMPEWFADEEVRHRLLGIPMTKEMVREIKAREREIDARPIKKVLEAKGRQKLKLRRSMTKLNEKVTLITENATMTDKEKANSIEALYRKAFRKKKEETTYVIASRTSAAKRPKRPSGVKGRYMQVDKRMLKEKRCEEGPGAQAQKEAALKETQRATTKE